jgi:hypothetical protein
MKNNFPPKLSNNSAIKDDAIIKSISICLALLLYTALNSCDTDNTKNIKKIQKDFISERLVTRDSPSLDTALVQQIK